MQKKSGNCLLRINESDRELRVSLSGEIDHHSAVWVRSEIDERILREKPLRTVLDLSGIDFMDSSGVGLIMGRCAKMQAVGGELILSKPNARVLKIFKMAGLDRIVKLEDCEEEEKR